MNSEIDTFLARVARAPAIPLIAHFRGTKRFELRERLGSGAFGDVYEARDREYGSRVALKVLKSASPDSLFRFKREFRAVADISHPNLVRLFELQQHEEHWILTMELIEGSPFDEHLRRAPEQLRSCFAQLARGISALHGQAVLHRDIKPTNVLVERTGRVVVLDFGLASEDDRARESVVAGTPHYMAPEQLEGLASPASDWFALGVMLYESVTGETPFTGTDLEARLRGPEPRDARDPKNQDLAVLAQRLLRPGPEERAGAEEILAALRASPTPTYVQADDTAFVGRAVELARLESALVESARRPTVITIVGEPGMGKSFLARKFLGGVRERGLRLYEGRCHEAESLPFKGIDGLVDMLCEELRAREEIDVASLRPKNAHALTRMFPVLKRVELFDLAREARGSSGSPQELRRAAFEALRELFAKLADDAPLVLFLDDLQWAEADSLELLQTLLSGAAPNMLLVLTARRKDSAMPEPLQNFLADLASIQGVASETIELFGLEEANIETLVQGLAGSDIDAQALWRDSGGHPFLISRMLHSGGASAARDIASVLAEDFRLLDEQSLAVLRYVCLSAAPLSQLDACRLAGLQGESSPVDTLRRAKLVRTLGIEPSSVIKPYHDRVRESLVAEQAEGETRRLHAELAEYLQASSLAPADAIATHYAGSGQREPTRIWAHRAAKEAKATLAFARAAELYELATGACDDREIAVTLHEEWARSIAALGRSVDAGQVFLAGAKLARENENLESANTLLAQAGEHLMLGGELAVGSEVILQALKDSGVDLPDDQHTAVAKAINYGAALAVRGLAFEERAAEAIDPEQARLVDILSSGSRALGFTDVRAPYLGALGLTLALELGDTKRVQRAMCDFVMTNAVQAPDHELFWEAIEGAFALASTEEELAWSHMIRGLTRQYDGDVVGCLPDFREAERRYWNADPPLLREASAMRILIMFCCIGDGVDLPFAIENCESWIAEADSRSDVYAGNFIRLAGSWLQLCHDQAEEARHCLEALQAQWTEVDDDVFWSSVRIYRVGIELYQEPGNALELINAIEPEFNKRFVSMLPLHKGSFHTIRGHAAVAAQVCGSESIEATRARVEESIEVLESVNYWSPTRHGLRAHLAFMDGKRDEAARHFQRAAQEWREETQEVFALSASLRRAEVLQDEALAESQRQALRALGVVDPDRYSCLFAGPSLNQG